MSRPTREPNGDTLWHGFMFDITGKKEVEQRLSLSVFAMDCAPVAIHWIRMDGSIFYANEAACQMLGYRREQLLGMTLSDLNAGAQGETWASHWETLKARKSMHLEVTHKTAYGRCIPVEVRANYLLYEGQEFKCAIVRDLTDQKAQELALSRQSQALEQEVKRRTLDLEQKHRALQLSEERLRLALEGAQSGTFEWNLLTGKLHWSSRHEKLWGYGAGEFDGTYSAFADRVHPDDLATLEGGFQTCKETRSALAHEFRVIWPDGSIRWIWGRGEFTFNDQGRATVMRGTVMDITQRKLAEQSLRENEARLRQALRGADLALWDWNIAKNSAYYSDEWIAMLGYSRGDVSDQPMEWRHLIHPDDVDRVLERLSAHLSGKVPAYEVEHRLLTKHHAWKWVWTSGKVWERDAKGHPLRFTGTHLDISTRKEMEATLRTQQDLLTHCQRLTTTGELAATMAHQLNQPLGGVVSYLTGIRLRFPNLLEAYPHLAEAIGECLRLSESAADIVSNIKRMAQRHLSARESLQLGEVIASALALVRHELERRRVEVDVRLEPIMPIFFGQRILLEQLLINLFLNAMEAMDDVDPSQRKIVISASFGEDHHFVLRVSDTGPGFPANIADQLFDPFFSTKAQGLGLGLCICRTIVESHGGWMRASSTPKEMTIFHISLPNLADNSLGTPEIDLSSSANS